MGQHVHCTTLQAVDTTLGRSYAILKSQLTTHLKAWKSMLCEVARWKIRSLHGRHIVELTTPMGQYVHCTTLQAVDTALGRSYAILKSQLITHLKAWKSALRGRTVEDQIATRARTSSS